LEDTLPLYAIYWRSPHTSSLSRLVIKIGIITTLVNSFNRFVSKRLCTKEQFAKVCTMAVEQAGEDADGYINYGEAVKIIYKSLKAGRMS